MVPWFEGSASEAVSTCKASSGILVVFIEPHPSVMAGARPGETEAPLAMYARGATAAMHRITFPSPIVRESVSAAPVVCLRLQDGGAEANDFAALFSLPRKRPCLFMISANGDLLVQKIGFVGVAAFVGSLRYAQSSLKNPQAASTTAALLAAVAAGASGSASKSAPSEKAPVVGSEEEDSVSKRPEGPVAAGAKSTSTTGKPTEVGSTAIAASSVSAADADHLMQSATVAPSVHSDRPSVEYAESGGLENRNDEGSTERLSLSVKERKANPGLPSSSMKLGGSGSHTPARLGCRLPDSRMIRKEFPRSTRFETVRAWVAEEAGLSPNRFLLGTTFPHRVYDAADDRMQLQELDGLCPSASMVVTLKEAAVGGGDGAGSSLATAASYVSGAVTTVAGFAAGLWRVGRPATEVAGNTEGERPDRAMQPSSVDSQPGRGSMASLRREEGQDQGDNLTYDNGNSTQFGSDATLQDDVDANSKVD